MGGQTDSAFFTLQPLLREWPLAHPPSAFIHLTSILGHRKIQLLAAQIQLIFGRNAMAFVRTKLTTEACP